MILQNIIFPKYGICSDFNLYFRLSNDNNYSYQNNHIFMNAGGWAHFDTYFNGLFINKIRKYTNAGPISINLWIKGTMRITILHKERENSGKCTNKKINEIEICTKELKLIEIPINEETDQGMYTFSIYAISDDCLFTGGYYSSKILNSECKNVKIGLAICTFKREKYIIKNIECIKRYIFNNPDSNLKDNLIIFISDNANTLDINYFNDQRIKLYKNKNVGGAGGFTRCLIEIMNNPSLNITHALLMDDDINFEPESLFRTYSFLNILKEEYSDMFIGGAMLRLDEQHIQTESGAIWNGGRLISLKHGLDLSTCESCLFNDIEESCEYNAWWYCSIPMQYIRPDNLPMPLFIRGDDVEYGLRNVNHIIQVNGICVWHEPFENKYSSSMYYYIFRNRLIDNSVRSIPYSLNQFLDDFHEQWLNEIHMYRYKNAELLVRGVEDFLKGVDWLKNTDAEKLHQAIMDDGYRMTFIEKLDFKFMYKSYDNSFNIPQKNRIIKRITNNGFLLSPKYDIVAPTFNANPDQFYRANNVLNYDYTSKKGFITKKDKNQMKKELKRYDSIIKNCKKYYTIKCKEYGERKNELITLEFWNKYLDIEEKS